MKKTEIHRKRRGKIASGLAVTVKTLNRGRKCKEEKDVVRI